MNCKELLPRALGISKARMHTRGTIKATIKNTYVALYLNIAYTIHSLMYYAMGDPLHSYVGSASALPDYHLVFMNVEPKLSDCREDNQGVCAVQFL